MCGILGYVGKVRQQDFTEALKKINYRGPDYTGIFDGGNICLGHNRLSIIDLDRRSNQPFKSACGNYVLIYNGEIYNFRSLRRELEERGHSFRTTSDTEVLLNAYLEWKEDCFLKFHGMFAVGIYDIRENELILARDRMGEKPLFYYLDSEKLVFSSEMKAMRPLTGPVTTNYEALVDFLQFGFVPSPKTIFREIYKLGPGTFLKFDLSDHRIIAKQEYFKVDLWSHVSPLSTQDKISEFDSIAQRVAKEISISDVSYGAFLSGGVDSSGAVAYLKDINPNLQAFTIGFDDQEYDETAFSRVVAKHLNVSHTVRQVKMDDVYGVYDKLVGLYDEPYNDFSFIPTYHVCKTAKQLGTVVISGDGADELFCGYKRYYKLQRLNAIQKYGLLRKAIESGSKLLPRHSDIRKQLGSIGQADNDFLYYNFSSAFKPSEVAEVANPGLHSILKGYSAKSVTDGYLSQIPESLSLLQKMRYLDLKMTLPDDMLVKIDRASMINSLEVRAFYLHPSIIDFAFTLRDEELANARTAKYFLKKAFESKLPAEILYRPKMGFTVPLKNWIFSGLNELVREALDNLPEEFFNKKQINKILEMQKKGQRDFILQIHALMFLGWWLKKNEIHL